MNCEDMLDYVSQTGIVIKVGQNAKENDELSLSADALHWWFHATDVPGAHVIACAPVLDRETKRDAAILAAHHSKAPRAVKMTPVDMCQVEEITKDVGANHGQVLAHDVQVLTVFMNKATEKARLGRLLSHVR